MEEFHGVMFKFVECMKTLYRMLEKIMLEK